MRHSVGTDCTKCVRYTTLGLTKCNTYGFRAGKRFGYLSFVKKVVCEKPKGKDTIHRVSKVHYSGSANAT